MKIENIKEDILNEIDNLKIRVNKKLDQYLEDKLKQAASEYLGALKLSGYENLSISIADSITNNVATLSMDLSNLKIDKLNDEILDSIKEDRDSDLVLKDVVPSLNTTQSQDKLINSMIDKTNSLLEVSYQGLKDIQAKTNDGKDMVVRLTEDPDWIEYKLDKPNSISDFVNEVKTFNPNYVLEQ